MRDGPWHSRANNRRHVMTDQQDPLEAHLDRISEFVRGKHLDKVLSDQDYHDVFQQFVEIVIQNVAITKVDYQDGAHRGAVKHAVAAMERLLAERRPDLAAEYRALTPGGHNR